MAGKSSQAVLLQHKNIYDMISPLRSSFQEDGGGY